MEFKSSNPKFTNRFMGHFKGFIEENNLFKKDASLLVTVSGGIDSMAMLYALSELKSFGYSSSLRVVHINHNSRIGQKAEGKMVAEFCKVLGIDCKLIKLDKIDPNRNFEYKARVKRYEEFYSMARADEQIVLAHHIDDSFEWTMLQSLRSSSIEGLVGIPVKNNKVIRPFMCVTKKQIEKFVKYFDLPFIDDPTNEQLKYERNFIRNEVITAFKDRHPKYLKHYVYRHNEIARRLGVHLVKKNKSHFHISYGESSVLIYSFSKSRDFSGLEDLVLKAVKYLNPNSRGSLNLQLKKIGEALKNNKVGPLNLVGKYKAYLDHNMVLITDESEKSLAVVEDNYQKYTYDQFHNYLKDRLKRTKNHFDFPFIVLIKGHHLDKRKFAISFNSENLDEFGGEDIQYYPALKLLREWSKKRNRHVVLRLNFLTTV